MTHSARSGCRVGARHDFYIKPGATFVDPGMTSPRSFRTFSLLRHSGQAKRDPESISNALHFSQKTAHQFPDDTTQPCYLALKGFRRLHIMTLSVRSGCRVGARHDVYIKPGATFVDPGMTSPRSFRTFSPLCHSGQAQRDPESISNALHFSQKTAHQFPDDTTQPCYLAQRRSADSIS